MKCKFNLLNYQYFKFYYILAQLSLKCAVFLFIRAFFYIFVLQSIPQFSLFGNIMKLRNLLLYTSLLSAPLMWGWGQKGHDTVAYIAECHLTPETKAAAEELLDGKSIVYYANWLDNASHTPEYAYSKTWHYKNIDAGENYENVAINEDGDIVKALEDNIKILGDKMASKEEKALALKMVVHFLGDIHQPLHMGHASDLGGNRVHVKYFKSPTNLHTVWDSRLVESAHKWSYTEWQQQIDRASEAETRAILDAVTPEDWARETLCIVREIYKKTPQDTNIEYDYIAEWTPVIERQLLKGGLRLAKILNETLTQ